MNTTAQVIANVRENRAKVEAEEARWTRYRAEANPPAWFAVFAVVAALAGMLAFAVHLTDHPTALRSSIGLLITPCAAVLCLVAGLARRREKAIVRALRDEAPTLFAKLKEERLIQ